MTPVDCDCDAGETDGGICPDCLGWGWYFQLDLNDLRRQTAQRN